MRWAFASYILIASIVGAFMIEDGAPVTYAALAGLLWPVALIIGIAEEIYRKMIR